MRSSAERSPLDRIAWPAVAAALGAGALAAAALPRLADAWAWRPGRIAGEPWLAFTAALVHLTPLHLAANLAGLALVAWLGLRARLDRRHGVAWAIAWPLTQCGLLVRPDLARYAGLSGVLHAGVAIVAVALVASPRRARDRTIGALLLAGIAAKVALEAPWAAPTRVVDGWDFAIAPMAHASGVVTGVVAGLVAARWPAPAAARARGA